MRIQNLKFLGIMGRLPLPEKVKSVRGTVRKCRKRDEVVAPKVELVDVNVPSHLKGKAREIFELKVRQCFGLGILAEIDIDALALYAWEMAELLQLQQRLKKEDYVVTEETKSGPVMKTHPLVKVVTAKLSTVNAIGSQFGWSPVSRIRLAAMASGKDKDKDDFEDSINGK